MIFVTLPLFLLFIKTVYAGKDRPVFSDELTELIEMIHDECVDQTGVAEEDIKNCELGIFKDDEKLKCYMFCIMEEAGLVDDDLVLDYDLMFSLVPEKYLERLQNMLNPCRYLDTLDKPKCQRSFDVHKCAYERDPDFYYIL